MSTPQTDSTIEAPIACDLTAIDAVQRDQHLQTAAHVFRLAVEVTELSNGYALRLPNETETFLRAASFIAHERLCCPFFGFALEIEPEGGALWLKLTGRDGVKLFLQSQLGAHLEPEVARAAQLISELP